MWPEASHFLWNGIRSIGKFFLEKIFKKLFAKRRRIVVRKTTTVLFEIELPDDIDVKSLPVEWDSENRQSQQAELRFVKR
jgi:hypothetical protein